MFKNLLSLKYAMYVCIQVQGYPFNSKSALARTLRTQRYNIYAYYAIKCCEPPMSCC